MQYVTLGRTGLKASRLGLGCGGVSKLGLRAGGSQQGAERLVKRALELGVNLFDTAETYGTEELLGRALKGVPRDEVIISSKKAATDADDKLVSGEEFLRGLEGSLRRLGTDYVDLYHVHALMPGEYDHALKEIVPAMLRAREAGKLRFIGVTEEFIYDPGHEMLARALADDVWDAVMVGLNMLNPSARGRVFPLTAAKGVGTLVMFAVRRALSRPEKLREVLDTLKERGLLESGKLDVNDPLGFLVGEGKAGSVVEAAYRFCRGEAGADVVLSGTGSVAHLEANVRAVSAPPLPEDLLARLEELFGEADCVSGN